MSTVLRDVRSPGWTADAAVAVLFLHGFGSHEYDLAGLAPELGLGLGWASLRAPIELGDGGAAWFELNAQADPAAEPVVRASDAVWAWVAANLNPGAKVLPIGFSQGGLMATQLLRTRPDRVVAPVVLGGFVLGAPQPGDAVLAQTRPAVFSGRGLDDQVIPASAVEFADSWLSSHATLTARAYLGLAHGINAAEVADVREFVRTHIG